MSTQTQCQRFMYINKGEEANFRSPEGTQGIYAGIMGEGDDAKTRISVIPTDLTPVLAGVHFGDLIKITSPYELYRGAKEVVGRVATKALSELRHSRLLPNDLLLLDPSQERDTVIKIPFISLLQKRNPTMSKPPISLQVVEKGYVAERAWPKFAGIYKTFRELKKTGDLVSYRVSARFDTSLRQGYTYSVSGTITDMSLENETIVICDNFFVDNLGIRFEAIEFIEKK